MSNNETHSCPEASLEFLRARTVLVFYTSRQDIIINFCCTFNIFFAIATFWCKHSYVGFIVCLPNYPA